MEEVNLTELKAEIRQEQVRNEANMVVEAGVVMISTVAIVLIAWGLDQAIHRWSK